MSFCEIRIFVCYLWCLKCNVVVSFIKYNFMHSATSSFHYHRSLNIILCIVLVSVTYRRILKTWTATWAVVSKGRVRQQTHITYAGFWHVCLATDSLLYLLGLGKRLNEWDWLIDVFGSCFVYFWLLHHSIIFTLGSLHRLFWNISLFTLHGGKFGQTKIK